MSIGVEDEELKDIVRKGGKIVARAPAEKPAAAQPTDAEKIISAIQALDTTLIALAGRPSPSVSVDAPKISFAPKIDVQARKAPTRFRVTIEERDRSADQRIKSLIIEAID